MMIEIDGSHGEGGGSLVRQAIALSLVTKKPFRITNIRSGRPNPGLNHQHLASIELARNLSNSKIIGASLGSQSLEFYPGDMIAKEISLDIGSAGAVVLALQSVILPCIVSAKKYKFTLKGGTDVAWSPPVDYFKEIFLSSIEQYGKLDLQIQRRGYYPKGGGTITLIIHGNQSNKEIDRATLGKPITLKGNIFTSRNFWKTTTPEKVTELAKISISGTEFNANVSSMSADSDSEGASFIFYGIYEDALIKDKFIRVGISEIAKNEDELIARIEQEASKFKSLIHQHIPADEYLTDQIIPFIGFFGGKIKTNQISEHTKSNIYLSELFLNKKYIIDEKNNIISCSK
jgi:RNA 3'-terminal phosphate cyclase (GTP)